MHFIIILVFRSKIDLHTCTFILINFNEFLNLVHLIGTVKHDFTPSINDLICS